MPRFNVTTREVTTIERSKTFECADEATAKALAEAEDWRDWEEDRYDCSEAAVIGVYALPERTGA